jgi:hypothetical protein
VHGESPASRLPTLNYCTRLGGWPMPTTGTIATAFAQTAACEKTRQFAR